MKHTCATDVHQIEKKIIVICIKCVCRKKNREKEKKESNLKPI